jgi:hypothetical protein
LVCSAHLFNYKSAREDKDPDDRSQVTLGKKQERRRGQLPLKEDSVFQCHGCLVCVGTLTSLGIDVG